MNSDSIPQESTVPVGTVAQKAIHADLAFFFITVPLKSKNVL